MTCKALNDLLWNCKLTLAVLPLYLKEKNLNFHNPVGCVVKLLVELFAVSWQTKLAQRGSGAVLQQMLALSTRTLG